MPLSGFQTLKGRSIGLREGLALHHNPGEGSEEPFEIGKDKGKMLLKNEPNPLLSSEGPGDQRLNMSHWCILDSHKGQQHIKLCQQEHCQEIKGRDYSLLLITQ